MKQPVRLFRTASARLLAAHLALMALITTLVFAFIYWQAGGVIDAEQREVVEAELREMADDYKSGGPLALARTIERRIRDEQERDAVYLLALPSGSRIAGNLSDWPPTIAPGSGWSTLELYRVGAETPTTISAVSLRLPRGERLLVGRDVAARAAFDATLARALGLALAAMLALSLAAAWLLSRLSLRRVREISRTAEAFMGGALEQRIALTGSGDEFDQLAGALNAMLDRIAALVGDLRMVTDSLAHDLRSPLGRLTRHLEAAQSETASPEQRTARIGQALEEAQATLSIATGLLEISRIEAGLAAEQFEPVDLATLARDVAELYEAPAEERGALRRARDPRAPRRRGWAPGSGAAPPRCAVTPNLRHAGWTRSS